jgi:ubiquinone/menaquinone biosynthesis C-methylase UbiE
MHQSVDRNADYVQNHPQLGRYGAHSVLLEAAIRISGHRPGLVVDVGCGEGRTLASLKERFAADRLIGIDLSVHRARIAAGRGLQSLVADGYRLPLANGSSSLVVCRHVIEHVQNDNLLLQDMRRILHEDGVMYIETPLRRRGAWYFYRNDAGGWVLDPTHIREYRSVEEFEEVLVQNRLTPIQFNVRPVTFPLTHVVYRMVSRRKPPSDRVAALLEKKTINLRVPRYGEIQALARRSVHRDER